MKATENLDTAHATNWLDAIDGSAADQRRHRHGLSACDAVHLARAAYWAANGRGTTRRGGFLKDEARGQREDREGE